MAEGNDNGVGARVGPDVQRTREVPQRSQNFDSNTGIQGSNFRAADYMQKEDDHWDHSLATFEDWLNSVGRIRGNTYTIGDHRACFHLNSIPIKRTYLKVSVNHHYRIIYV